MNDDQEGEKEKTKNKDCGHSSSLAKRVFLFFTLLFFFFLFFGPSPVLPSRSEFPV